MRTRIELSTSGDVDMYDDVPCPLTFAIADIREPDKRNAHFSKTIKVPATKGNNIRFGHLFDVNISEGRFNPNRKAECVLYIDDVPQLKGYLRVIAISINDKGKMEYDVSIQGNVSNIFLDLQDLELDDLDLSAYNHTLNRTTIKNSYTNNYTNGYCYPLADYGYDNNLNSWKVEHLVPSVFVRTLIDKIFSGVGYTYESSFFDSARFKNLLIPCSTEFFKYTQTQVNNRLFKADKASDQSITGSATSQQITFTNEIVDTANAYDTTTSKWTVPYTGYYDLQANISWDTSGTYFGSPVIPTFLEIKKNGVAIASTYDQSVSTVTTTRIVNVTNVFCVAGDVCDVWIRALSNSYSGMSWNIRLGGTTFYNQVSAANLQAGDTVILSNCLPRKIKQRDFLFDIIRMFGLYVETSQNNSKKLLIETRDDFYSSGTVIDWSEKLDYDSPFEVMPMGELQNKNYRYSYKEDKDYYNKKYNDAYINDLDSKIYGDKNYVVDNDFVKATHETKVMFSPTPLVQTSGDDKIIPKIFEVDSSNQIKNKPYNIRLWYNGGVKSTSVPFDLVDTTNATVTESQTTYLYAGHLDNPQSPTFDLSFGVPKEVFYNTSVYTDGNLFNIYHKKYLQEITDKDSKIVTAYFRLRPSDIEKLDFRNKFYFENQYWRLNKIYDYNPISEELTKCEFIRILEGASFTAALTQPNGGIPTGVSKGTTPVLDKPADKQRNLLVTGNNNNIGGLTRNGIIIGDDNYVHGGTNISLINSSGCVIYDGVQNVTLINSSGVVVDESNTFVINNTVITSGDIAGQFGAWNSQSYNSSDYYDTGGGTWTVDNADLTSSKYKVIGKTMYWNLVIENSTFAASVVFPTIKIPQGYTVGSYFIDSVVVVDGTVMYNDVYVYSNTGNDYVEIRAWDSGAFANATNSVSVAFSITFEIE